MLTTPAQDTPPVPPRAPTVEEWARLSPYRRETIEQDLYVAAVAYEEALRARMSAEELAAMAESDTHGAASWDARNALRSFYRRAGGNLYIASNLAVYYPGENHFAPDLLAVRDVPQRDRDSYVVLKEGKGLDLVVEIIYKGNRAKDLKDNVTRYAALGIPEYFVVDLPRNRIHGYHLATPDARRYTPLLGDHGRYRSTVLGLDLVIEKGGLRFYYGTALVPLLEELAAAAQAAAAAAQETAAAAQETAAAAQETAAAAQETAAAAQETAAAAQERAEAAEERARKLRKGLTGALLALLQVRGLPFTDAQREQVQTCEDADLLMRWISRAATAASLDEILLDS